MLQLIYVQIHSKNFHKDKFSQDCFALQKKQKLAPHISTHYTVT